MRAIKPQPKRTPQQKEAIYAMPLQKQFRIVHIDADSGCVVYQHILVDSEAKDYEQVLAVSKAYAKETTCWLNPEVDRHAEEARKQIYPGLPSKNNRSNPDLTTEKYGYIDVKSPFNKSNIVRNANLAYKQNAIAVITDLMLDAQKEEIIFEEIEKFTERIFSERNVNQQGDHNYNREEVHWYVKGILIKCNKPKRSNFFPA